MKRVVGACVDERSARLAHIGWRSTVAGACSKLKRLYGSVEL